MNQPTWEDKCWGRVWHIFASPHAAVSLLEVEVGKRCSYHYHKDRANMFAVQSGVVVIEERQDAALLGRPSIIVKGEPQYTILGPGDSHSVPSGIYHRFRVMESGRMVEVYWNDCEVSYKDIVREDVGGDDPVEGIKQDLKNNMGKS